MNNSFYFTHDYDARNDQKILQIRAKFGWQGYGIYFAILESLCQSNGYILREALAGLSLGLSLPFDDTIKYIDSFIEVGLLSENNKGIYSKRILEHLKKRKALSEAGRRGGSKSRKQPKKEEQATLKPPLSEAKATPEAGKERKGEEKKGKESKVNIDFEVFWNLYDKKRGDKDKISKKWESLKDDERQAIIEYIPKYKSAQPDKQFRKDPQTFLNNKSWNDEIISNDIPKIPPQKRDMRRETSFTPEG